MNEAAKTAKPRTLASLVFIVLAPDFTRLFRREAAAGDSDPRARCEPAWESRLNVENSPIPLGLSDAGSVKEPLRTRRLCPRHQKKVIRLWAILDVVRVEAASELPIDSGHFSATSRFESRVDGLLNSRPPRERVGRDGISPHPGRPGRPTHVLGTVVRLQRRGRRQRKSPPERGKLFSLLRHRHDGDAPKV